MNKKYFLWIIIIIASIMRLYKIGVIPFGYNWDETSILYNAWGIALWHRDEWANLMPLAFRSFGDYKAPLLFYLLAVPFTFTGIVPVLIRVYSAIAGIITVVGTYHLAKELSKNTWIPVIATLLVAVSPWAVNFSRVGFEANIGLSLVVMGSVTLLWGLKKPVWFLGSAFFYGLSLYAYHSTKIFVPVFLIGFLIGKYRNLKKAGKYFVSAIVLGTLMTAPLLYVTFFGKGFERGLTMIFFDDNHRVRPVAAIVSEGITNVVNQFSLSFLIKGQDAVGLRHLTKGYGIMYGIELPFFLYGLIISLIHSKRISKIPILWLVVGSLPAVVSHQTPHAVRSLLIIPAIQIISATGFVNFIKLCTWPNRRVQQAIVLVVVGILGVQCMGYIKTYYSSYAIASAHDFQYGYKEAIAEASKLGRTKDKIVMTDKYGQPYIFVLLENRIKPEEFLAGALANYEFHTFKWPYYKPNAVIVGTPAEIPPTDAAVKKTITIPGTDTVVFVIAETPKE